MAPLRACIFDLDGTLVNSLGHIASACNHVLRTLGHKELPEQQYSTLAGGGNKKLLKATLEASTGSAPTEQAVNEAVAMKRAYDDAAGASNAMEFDGISDMLAHISSAGMQIAVLSNKTENLVRIVAEKCFPSVKFVAVHGARDDVPLKPSPVPATAILQQFNPPLKSEECAFVGDTQVDVKTGISANMVPVAVSWGFRTVEELRAAGAEYVATDSAHLTQILVNHGK